MSANIQNLLQKLKKKKVRDAEVLSTGCPALDALLPFEGIRRGSILEWIGAESFVEAALCSLLVSRNLIGESQHWLVVDSTRQLYPSAVQSFRLPLREMIYMTTHEQRDEQWACEQALRCSALGMIWGIQPAGNLTTFRRFQVAAEQAGTIGMFVFDQRRLAHRCWADARLMVTSLPSGNDGLRFHIEVVRSMRGNLGKSLIVNVDETGVLHEDRETNRLPVVSELANSAVGAG